jgi:hypothetical protein
VAESTGCLAMPVVVLVFNEIILAISTLLKEVLRTMKNYRVPLGINFDPG